MKRTISLIISAIMLLTLFSACGEKKEKSENALGNYDTEADESRTESDTAEPETANEPETEPMPEPEPVYEDAPSVLYYTEYTDRIKRIGKDIELMTLDAAVPVTDSWYADAAIRDATELLMTALGIDEETAKDMLYTDELRIYTAIDPEIQSILEEFYKDDSNFPAASTAETPESAMVITDPETGDVLALVGGRGEKGKREFNYATDATRSPGSSIKPVSVYGPALEKGIITYAKIYEDSPYSGEWPANYPEGYRGATEIHDAVCRSVNTIAVKILMDLGAGNSIDFLVNKVGISTLVTSTQSVYNDRNAAALALGGMAYGVTPEELTAAYQIFANKGNFNDSRTVVKILDREGKVIVDNSGTAQRAVSEANASIMTLMLEEVVDRGTADDITLKDRIAVAGKTGTSDNFHDKWFVGYTPYYAGGVWFGYSTPKNLNSSVASDSPSTEIWDKVMTRIHEAKVFTDNNYQKEFERSKDMTEASVCRGSGLLAGEGCTNVEKGYFDKNLISDEKCTQH